MVRQIKNIKPHEIGGHVGDMVSLESALGFKKLFELFNRVYWLLIEEQIMQG